MKSTLDSGKNKNRIFWRIARELARTRRIVRLTNQEADAFYGADFELEGRLIDLGEMVSVSQVWFAKTVGADVSTVNRWLHKGMPVLKDATLPYRDAREWVFAWRERTGHNDRVRHDLEKQAESLKS